MRFIIICILMLINFTILNAAPLMLHGVDDGSTSIPNLFAVVSTIVVCFLNAVYLGVLYQGKGCWKMIWSIFVAICCSLGPLVETVLEYQRAKSTV